MLFCPIQAALHCVVSSLWQDVKGQASGMTQVTGFLYVSMVTQMAGNDNDKDF